MAKTKTTEKPGSHGHWYFIIGLVAIAGLFTHRSVQGGLLNYDDERYIAGNPHLQKLSGESVAGMFTTYFDGHYHPLTLLSLAVDKQLAKDEIRMHHLVNWLLHLANAVLAYLFLFALFRNQWLAFGAALLFAVHPMAVESYAWMTERKNVLYSFFFLAAALAYFRYLAQQRPGWWWACFALFVLSMLSKAQAITLLPVLFLVDFVLKRDFKSMRIYLEKIPFLVLILVFAFLTSSAQVSEWGVANTGYSGFQKVFLGSTAFFQYVFKGFFPLHLSAYYPYPNNVGRTLQWFHFVSPVFLLAFVALLVWAFKRSVLLFFGLTFFFVNIVLMLKFLDVPFGNYLMANRYNYLPLIGLMLVLVQGLFFLSKKYFDRPRAKAGLLLAVAVVYGLGTWERTKVWNNSVALWADVIENYPKYGQAYNTRGLGHLESGQQEAARQDFIKAMEVSPEVEDGYMNMAVLEYQLNRPQKALPYMKEAKKRFPENARVFRASASINQQMKNSQAALKDIERAIALEPGNEEARATKAYILVEMGRTEEARAILKTLPKHANAQKLLLALEQQEKPAGAPAQSAMEQSNRLDSQATQLAKQGKLEQALPLYNQALQLAPENAVAHLNRGSTLAQLKRFEEALTDFKKAVELNPAEPRGHYLLGVVYRDMGQRDLACSNFYTALQKGMSVPPDVRQYCR